MNKYDFDFKKIEDILYDVLGIVNPTDINSLKLQINQNLKELSSAISQKCLQDASIDFEKDEKQKSVLQKELDEINNETDLEKILKKCITVRYMVLLSLDVKVREEDSYEEKMMKEKRRTEIFAISDLVKSVPSLVDLINQRNNLLKYVDFNNRIIQFDTNFVKNKVKKSEVNINATNFNSANTNISVNCVNKKDIVQYDNSFNVIDDINIENNTYNYPKSKLDIKFNKRPIPMLGKYSEKLEKKGIHVYNFGSIDCLQNPDKDGNYTEIVNSKKLVGVLKNDEFGKEKKYTILMNDISEDVPVEFCSDILFSDMVLRNSKNNFGFIGNIRKI